MGVLVCPVRNCGAPLEWAESVRCPHGHSFDRARSGYCNLLQPQDKRSRAPGDSRATAQARRRTLERGLGNALRDALIDEITRLMPRRLLDVGCGEGFYLRALEDKVPERWGVDLSAAAIDLAAARDPAARYIVANADRRLPFSARSFDSILSLTGPKNAAEFTRLLAPAGHLLVAVAGADDLAELREALLGRAQPLERARAASERFAGHFEKKHERSFFFRTRLDAAGLADLLATTYRGARHRERERLAGLSELTVTTSWVLLVFTAGR